MQIACAMALPADKLKFVTILCGLGPPDIGMKGADFIHQIGLTIGWRYSPAIFLRWFLQSEPRGQVDLSDEKRLELLKQRVSKSEGKAHEKDLQVWKDEGFRRVHLQSTRESFKQGFDGVLLDGKLMCMEYGFRIEDIRPDLPMKLWYSKHDTSVLLNHGKQIVARLGGQANLRVLDETHASLPVNWREEILTELLASMRD
ncbi:alpha/beta hydrolase [Xylogone sp. PMI_703]|nr:alpha/beta hydrolase [Xylogone sp. PMI_703]